MGAGTDTEQDDRANTIQDMFLAFLINPSFSFLIFYFIQIFPKCNNLTPNIQLLGSLIVFYPNLVYNVFIGIHHFDFTRGVSDGK